MTALNRTGPKLILNFSVKSPTQLQNLDDNNMSSIWATLEDFEIVITLLLLILQAQSKCRCMVITCEFFLRLIESTWLEKSMEEYMNRDRCWW
jgi:hypothetical protein